jgi:hypothetical protein
VSARVVPEHPLATALARAADGPAERLAFYRLLLSSIVYVIGDAGAPGAKQRAMQQGEKLSIRHWQGKDGSAVVPFFTSLPALQRVLKEESGYLALPARELFALTRGASLVLDPMSGHDKEFYPDEVADLLDKGADHVAQTRAPAGAPAPAPSREIVLDQPPEPPAALIDALAALLPHHPGVQRAYLCRMHDPAAGDTPSLLVGFEGGDGLGEALDAARAVAAGAAPSGVAVDVVPLRAGDPGPSEYLLTAVAPFYTRTPPKSGLAATIRGWFGRV